jgi:hypothetical protein
MRLPKDELMALKRTIRRNLNQIAHAANHGEFVTSAGAQRS